MAKTNENHAKNMDYNIAAEEVVNFIDDLIVNRLSEKIEQQKISTDSTTKKLSTIEGTIDGISEASEQGNKNVKYILKLLLKDTNDSAVLDTEEYMRFDLVEHSKWEKKQIEALIQRPEFNCNQIYDRIVSECNRIKGDIIKELAERLIAENLGQKEKTQEIINVLLNQEKGTANIQSDEYYYFDIVDKVNYLEKKLDEIATSVTAINNILDSTKNEQALLKDKMLSILIRNDNDTVPDFFDEVSKSIKQDVNCIGSNLQTSISSVEQIQSDCKEKITNLLNECDKNNEKLQTEIQNVFSGLEELVKNGDETVKKVERKIYIVGGIIVTIQILSMVIPFFT